MEKVVHAGHRIQLTVELSVSSSSLGLGPAIAPRRRCKSSFHHDDKKIPIKTIVKSTTKSFNFPSKSSAKNLQPEVRLYERGQGGCSKYLSTGQLRRSSIRASGPVEHAGSDSVRDEVSHFGRGCLKFLRPYAIRGTVISSISLFARVLIENPDLFKWSLLFKALPGLIALILGNAYYIGINQIYDIDIDSVNKPYLPLPAGDLSVKTAWVLVILYLLAGLSIVRMMKADLITTSIYCLGLFLGTIYSVPPIRLKRFSVATSLVLTMMRGVLLNIGVSYASRSSLGLAFEWSPAMVFITTFATLFFLVITIIKDLTDVEGDSKFKIRTFAARFGLRNIAFFSSGLLMVNYIGAMVAAMYMPQAFNRNLMVPAHAILALCLLFQARLLDKANYTKEASAKFFQFLWKLLNAEYIIFPFI